MERIAVLYDVRQLDKKDWYRWGAEILIGHQSPDGSWTEDGGYPSQHPALNTSFALLFLKRANLTPDLSRRLTVDTAALTAKVDDKVTPRKDVPQPTKQPEPTPVVVDTPPPKKEVPPPTRAETSPARAADTTPTNTTSAKEESNSGLWIVLLVLLAVAGGGLVFFGIRRSRASAADEDEHPRKKKVLKKRVRAEED